MTAWSHKKCCVCNDLCMYVMIWLVWHVSMMSLFHYNLVHLATCAVVVCFLFVPVCMY